MRTYRLFAIINGGKETWIENRDSVANATTRAIDLVASNRGYDKIMIRDVLGGLRAEVNSNRTQTTPTGD